MADEEQDDSACESCSGPMDGGDGRGSPIFKGICNTCAEEEGLLDATPSPTIGAGDGELREALERIRSGDPAVIDAAWDNLPSPMDLDDKDAEAFQKMLEAVVLAALGNKGEA